jgi:hypothetical protein
VSWRDVVIDHSPINDAASGVDKMSKQQYQAYLDKSTPFTVYRWAGTVAVLFVFFLRIVLSQGWYIGTLSPALGKAPSASFWCVN